MDTLTKNRPLQTKEATLQHRMEGKVACRKHSTREAEILGAVILCPQLTVCIPSAINAKFSCYGLFLIKACSEGWGIEGIRHALDGFGLDGDDIVNACLASVRGDPANTFWQAIRKLCEGCYE